jgi:hypothetical protein
MELMAAIVGLEALLKPCQVDLYSDSQYAINCATGVYQRNKNLDLWREFDNAIQNKNVKFYWVKGHSGNPMNEVCDKLATAAMSKTDLKTDDGYVPNFVKNHFRIFFSVFHNLYLRSIFWVVFFNVYVPSEHLISIINIM